MSLRRENKNEEEVGSSCVEGQSWCIRTCGRDVIMREGVNEGVEKGG